MAVKQVKYKEPAGYFTPGMRKVAEQWEKEQAQKQKQTQKSSTGKKK